MVPAFARIRRPVREEENPFAAKLVRFRYVPLGQGNVVPHDFALYWTLRDRKKHAIRYRVTIGRNGLYERGISLVAPRRNSRLGGRLTR